MRMRPRAIALVAVVFIVGLVIVLSSGDDSGPSAQSAAAYREAHEGVCEALGLARAGETDRAHGVFLARAHFPLHQLAAEVTEKNRTTAARLLEAKATVEASLPTGAPTATADLSRLASATADAIEAAGSDRPAQCT